MLYRVEMSETLTRTVSVWVHANNQDDAAELATSGETLLEEFISLERDPVVNREVRSVEQETDPWKCDQLGV